MPDSSTFPRHRLSWNHIRAVESKHSALPIRSGVYAFCEVQRTYDLPTRIRIIYVGKARNLRRRFKQHLAPLGQHNIELFYALRTCDIEFWYAQSVEIDYLEKELIEKVKPPFNQRLG